MHPETIIAVIVAIVATALVTWNAAISYRKKVVEAKIGSAEEKAREIIDEALKAAEAKKREGLLELKEEALKMATEWMANLGKKYRSPGNVYGFLHFIVAYGLMSNYEADELLDLLISANHHKATPNLCRMLGLADKVLGEH